MYQISINFDDKANHQIKQYITNIARKSGNSYMLNAKVPPHITISIFNTQNVDNIISSIDENIHKFSSNTIQWVGIGVFFPYVIYLQPLLNQYLHSISCTMHNIIKLSPDVSTSKYYEPFNWLPHTTVGKKLSKTEMLDAFSTLQNSFSIFNGNVTKIILTKTNPYTEIKCWDLK